jgi:HD-GYP domain-containing protein (c-di-GMP phosphodiesterase class II)/putative methionine-R-sulfoxide reductase with GAF domain
MVPDEKKNPDNEDELFGGDDDIFGLTQRVQRMVRNLKTLLAVTEAISSELNVQVLLEKIIREAAGIFDAEKASLMLIEDGHLRIKAALGLPEEVIRKARVKVQPDVNISGHVAATGEPLFIRDIEQDKRFGTGRDKARGQKYETNSLISVPVKSRDGVIGVLNVNNKSTRQEFTKDDLALLVTVANQAGIALENASLYKQAQERIKELTLISDAEAEMNRAGEMADILSIIIDIVRTVMHDCEYAIYYVDSDSDLLEFVSGSGRMKMFYERAARKGKGRKREKERDAIYVRSLLSDFEDGIPVSNFDNLPLEDGFLLSVPLNSPKGVLGYLELYTTNRAGFDESAMRIINTILPLAAVSLENIRLYQELGEGYTDTIRALSSAIDAKDKYTIGHSERVALYAIEIGRALGFDEKELEVVERAGILHDIGKIGVSEMILGKPGRLNEKEFLEMKDHLRKSGEILKPIKFLGAARDGLITHHERMDGRGYLGLPGEKIPLLGRMLCIADAFDAMTSDRPYRKGLPIEVAIAELEKNKGTQFDDELVEVFVNRVIKPNIQPDGTLELPELREINKKAKVRFEYPPEMTHTTIQPLGVKEIVDADRKKRGEKVEEDDAKITSRIKDDAKKSNPGEDD